MLINGPATINAIRATDRIDLQPQQRITAGVIQVTPTQAVLSVNGYPIIARLTNPEQAAYLSDQRTAQFIVLHGADQQVILKLVRSGQNNSNIRTAFEQDLVIRMATELNLPADEEHLSIIRALISSKVAVSALVVNELREILNQMGEWKGADANLAASLKAAGLPLSLLSLQLAGQKPHPISADITDLYTKIIQAQTKPGLPIDFRFVLESMEQLLRDLIIDPSKPPDEIARAVSSQVALMGKSLENILHDFTTQSSPFWPESGLIILARMQQISLHLGLHELAETARQVLDDFHLAQWMNTAKPTDPSTQTWLTFPLAMSLPGSPSDMEDLAAKLKIASYPDPSGREVFDPHNTRLVFNFEFPHNQGLQLQLIIHSGQVSTEVRVTDETMSDAAAGEMLGLKHGIENMGYQVITRPIVVSDFPMAVGAVGSKQNDFIFQSISIEI